jgi:hypothetical protein
MKVTVVERITDSVGEMALNIPDGVARPLKRVETLPSTTRYWF